MTVISLSVPWQLGLPMLAGCHLLLWLVWLASGDVTSELAGQRRAETVAIWVMAHACLMTLCWLAPAGLWMTSCAMVFCVFIFRLSLVDQLTGFLPREMTVSFLAAGLLYATGSDQLPAHAFAAMLIGFVLYAWRQVGYWRNGREMLGLGDVWIGSALGAWLGLQPALYAITAGAGGFFVWLFLSRREGGPMGPWLGSGALLAMIFSLYQPALVW